MDATKTNKSISKSRMSPKHISNQSKVKLGCNLTQVTWVNLGQNNLELDLVMPIIMKSENAIAQLVERKVVAKNT